MVVSPDGKHVYVASEDRYRGGVAIFDRAANGTVRQKRGRSGCVSETGLRRACRQAIGVRAPRDLAISPDGRNVYVAAASGAVAVLDRDATDGTLTQRTGRAGCLARVGRKGACVKARGLHNPQGIVVSPDGSNVYVTSFEDDALTVFDRNAASGALKQKPGRAGCLAGEYSAARGCRTASLQVGLDGPALTVSGDGKHVYAGQPLQIFDRHANGELAANPSGGPSDAPGEVVAIVVSADGKNVYAAAGWEGLLIFDRDAASGALEPGAQTCFAAKRIPGCARATALAAPTGLALSPDGRDLYVASGVNQGNALVSFDRDPATGALTQKPRPAGCVSQSGTGGSCAKGRALREPSTIGEGSPGASLVQPTLSVTVSPDGESVYLAGDTVAVFDRR